MLWMADIVSQQPEALPHWSHQQARAEKPLQAY